MGLKVYRPHLSAGRANRIIIILFTIFYILFLGQAVHARSLKVLTTFLPIYIFTENVVGEREGVEVECLLPGDVGPHDYHMRPSDMRKVAGADAIIINGLGVDEFINKGLDRKEAKSNIFVSSDGLPLLRSGDDDLHRSHIHDNDVNPHTWVSPEMAILQVKNIARFLARIDPAGEEEYRKNAEEYIERLDRLQNRMRVALKGSKKRKVITFHNAFDYLARDVGFEIAGAIHETPDEEPSAGEISNLIKMMRDEGIKVIFTEPQYSDRMAGVVAKETGAKLLTLDPLATGELSADYYERVMMENLETLKKGLQIE